MKTQQLFAAVAVSLFAGAVAAAPVTSDGTGNFFEFSTAGSTLSRAQVQQEAQRAAPRSFVNEYDVVTPKATGVTRDEVIAELKRARADGALAQAEWFDGKPAEPIAADAATVIVQTVKTQGGVH